jgi:hypothetical protein
MTIPVRLDRLLLRWLPSHRDLDPAKNEDVQGFPTGSWLAVTALGAVLALALLQLPVSAPMLGIICSAMLAVPGTMMILRGVVDGVSARGRLPKYTQSTAGWFLCYATALGGSLLALVA